MGVNVGVIVLVGMLLGLGVMVRVGDEVMVGVRVELLVSFDAIVHVGEGLGVAGLLHAVSQHAVNNKQSKLLRFLLWSDGEKRVMIINFPMRNTKGIVSIADETLGRGGCPGEVARTSTSAVASQGEGAGRQDIIEHLSIPGAQVVKPLSSADGIDVYSWRSIKTHNFLYVMLIHGVNQAHTDILGSISLRPLIALNHFPNPWQITRTCIRPFPKVHSAQVQFFGFLEEFKHFRIGRLPSIFSKSCPCGNNWERRVLGLKFMHTSG